MVTLRKIADLKQNMSSNIQGLDTENLEYVIEPANQHWFDVGEIWRYRELFYFFTWRDIKIKYKQTTLGFLWAILQPLIMMTIFTLFFGKALHIPSQNLPYPVYVFSGLLVWNLFSSGLTNAANSMVSNALIIKKIYFPRLIIPVSSILVALFDFVMAFVLFIAILIFYQQSIGHHVCSFKRQIQGFSLCYPVFGAGLIFSQPGDLPDRHVEIPGVAVCSSVLTFVCRNRIIPLSGHRCYTSARFSCN